MSALSFLRNMMMRAAFNEQDTGLLLISCLEGLPITSLLAPAPVRLVASSLRSAVRGQAVHLLLPYAQPPQQ